MRKEVVVEGSKKEVVVEGYKEEVVGETCKKKVVGNSSVAMKEQQEFEENMKAEEVRCGTFTRL